MRGLLAGVVLLALFVVEVLAVVVFAVWGWHRPLGWLWVWLLPVLATALWGLLAAPRAPYRSPRVTPGVKVVFFAAAFLALRDLGHWHLALAFGATTALVHALAATAPVREVRDGLTPPDGRAPRRPPRGPAS